MAFHVDGAGDWVADLACLHGMHVRHRPPFEQRPWVLTDEGRRSRLGAEVDCVLCDRFELPSGLHVVRTAGPFDETTMPQGLRRRHRIADGRWGVLRVLAGSLELTLDMEPRVSARLGRGDTHALPPGVSHAVTVAAPVSFAVDFLMRGPASTAVTTAPRG